MAKNLHIAGSIGGESPKKLSDLENDLFYSKRTPFLTITEKDCEPEYGMDNSGNNTDEIIGYQYYGSPKLDWLKSLDDIYVRGELSFDPDGTGTNVERYIFNQTMLLDIGNGQIMYHYDEELGVTAIVYLGGIGIFNGENPFTQELFDGFTIAVAINSKFTLEIFKVEEKSLPVKQIFDWEECHSDAPGFILNKPFGIVCESSELFSFVELKDESTAVPKTLDPFNAETEYFSYIGDVRYPVEVKSAEDGTTYLEIVVDDSSTVQIYTDRIVGPVGLQVSLGYYNKTMLELDPKYVPSKMNVENPVGTGSFSMNRKEGTVIGENSHAEGYNTTASGKYSHAEGGNTTASNAYSHAEGNYTAASGVYSHAEGYYTKASGRYSHAEGGNTTASGDYPHAEGYNTTASGKYSHAEGGNTTASGSYSHAEGHNTRASGMRSHAEGYGTKALSNNQHVQGKYNVSDSDSKYAHIIGNGDSDSARSNAHTLDWAGNGWYAGDVFIGGTGQDDANVKKLATEEYVAKSLPNTLPNPNALTIKQGDTEVSYDGSDPLTVEIPSGAVGTPGADGKSAYQYAVEGGYTGTETEFAAKLAQEMPDALPNPNALTFTGAATGSYDGSEALTVNIPEGGNKTALDTFLNNADIDYSYDAETGAYYTVIRVYKQKLDGTKQYPFVYAPNGANAGDKSTYDMTVGDGWLLAINSGIFDASTKKPDGIIIQNGVIVQNSQSVTHSQCKPLTIDSNGDLSYAAYNVDAGELVAADIVSAVCGFMPIVVDYAAVDSSEWNSVSHYTENAQRQIIGQWGNGDYAIITCEGRNYHNSDGWTIAEAQAVCIKHGLKFAYNLDGGGSTETMLGLKPINIIYENTTGRIVPTFIVFNGSCVFSTDVDNTETNEFVFAIGSNVEANNDGIGVFNNTSASQRMCVVNTKNVPKFPFKGGSGTSDYAPIKITDGSTSVTITCNGFYPGIALWTTDGNEWTRTVDVGWGTLNGMTYEFPDGIEYTHYTVNFKNSSNSVIASDTDTSGISIVFE